MSEPQEPKVIRVTEADLQECEEFLYSLKWKLGREIRELRERLKVREWPEVLRIKADNALLREKVGQMQDAITTVANGSEVLATDNARLWEYVQHKKGCDLNVQNTAAHVCTCGLDKESNL